MVYSVVIREEDGGFIGRCRELPEIVGSGGTIEECCENLREVFTAYLREHGASILSPVVSDREGATPDYGAYFSLN